MHETSLCPARRRAVSSPPEGGGWGWRVFAFGQKSRRIAKQEETIMFSHRTALAAGCLGVLVCTISSPANALRVMTAWGAFRPMTTQGSQGCVQESVGGALNNCSTTQTYMVFEVPIETSLNPVLYEIVARSFGSASTPFTCYAVAMSPTAPAATFGTGNTFTASGIETKNFRVVVPAGQALRLQCQYVPRNKGILSISYAALQEN
jgi:hypothetical protein